MRKKHRDITVDGVTYGWIPKESYTTVYKDKKVWFKFMYNQLFIVTPSEVAKKIKKKLEEGK